MSEPTFETVRVYHPRIADSEHDVPKQSLAIIQRSGWLPAKQEPELEPEKKPVPEQPKSRKPVAEAKKEEK